MEGDITLNDRKKEILLSAVENYIENALPITSEKVQTNSFNTLSSATLRNELSNLEEMGFLKQLHTSGGRVPTTKAYRYFVNNLLVCNSFDTRAFEKVKDKFIARSSFILDVVDNLAKKVSEIVDYPIFVELKGYEELVIEAINIIPLITGQALVLVQTNAGIINNTINLNSTITEENCKDASKFLSTNLFNKKIKDVIDNQNNYIKLFKDQIKYFQELFITLTEVLKNFSNKQTFVKNNNVKNLLDNPEYKDVNSVKKFLNFIENENDIKEIIQNIDDNSNNEIVFSIGEENKNSDYSDYSIIKANYTMNSGITTSIGVVGPQRLDYAKIASALKFIIDELNDTNKEDNKCQNRKKK